VKEEANALVLSVIDSMVSKNDSSVQLKLH
jgi:hypothetical protein